ncbi:hypothetical protein [Planktosalinus lacus]|uniref:Uncharacterized protein n=1 Tax=Planktosalinus lacus TaxID=1526573 RepID=A0A8J2VB37_9FLAO|nr:hypothetical protein [Planktosalinus lacus]GGD99335.1 hypothetical protein GCM10011312_23550 [Planktosalinus lacus]
MDLQKIEQLLEAYFEGQTSIADEKKLKAYFSGNEVAAHLEPYRNLFVYFTNEQAETTETEIKLLQTEKRGVHMFMKQWYSIAALFVVALGVTFYFQNNANSITKAERIEAEIAFEKTKEALNFFSHQFNESAQKLSVLNEFGHSANKIFK